MKQTNQSTHTKYQGILLIGPTGSGKTPFGAYCEQNGLENRQCIHFDFGAELRKLAMCDSLSSGFRFDELTFIRQVLKAGKLLENEHFYIAEKMIDSFVSQKRHAHEGVILLNGMPRHLGQARDLDRIITIHEVIHLACAPEVVYERIRGNTGGDRIDRTDDTLDAIQNKLAVFQERTIPLLEYYKKQGAGISNIMIKTDYTAEDIHTAYLCECLAA